MPRRFIDLSVPLEAGIASDPEIMLPQIEYFSHKDTAEQMAGFFPGMTPDQLPGGDGWAVETLTVSTHNGTHLDAPYHHHSTMNGGERAITIDEVPLEWCFNPGVKLDFRHFDDGYIVTPDDVDAELERIGHTLQPLDIVVVNTSAGDRYGQPDFLMKGCGMGRDATLHLLEQGVRVTGTDAWSWDAPFPLTAQRFAKEGDPSIIWEGHRASMDIGYCHIEKLTNLDQLPPTGWTMSCFPFKIKAASAGFIRAVAIMED
ncbi:cyclase family protein [Marimonas sp. MJW-29]|uniref:Cyclase family protein n=1 Tax=Sulfitobacter sediminis TaxID=3234186 RepID=A0ABV3RT83_9RHOB